jgi:L-threonylcarbamoyladenylate synthase
VNLKLLTFSLDGEEKILKESVKVLSKGGLVVYPTDTVYGIGGDASKQKTVEKVFSVKQRPHSRAIGVMVSDFKMLAEHAVISEKQWDWVHELLPGRVTVVLQSKGSLASNLSPDDSLGFRIPVNPLALKIVEDFGKPITTTSANKAGKRTPPTIQGVSKQLGEEIDLYVDYGQLALTPSTVVDLRKKPVVLRKGPEQEKIKHLL